MHKQNGSIARSRSREEKLDLVGSLRDIAWRIFEREFSWFNRCDQLVVEGALPKVRLFYVCTETSSSDRRTLVECRFHFDSRQMWIGSIQVAACHRLQGVGRQLVRVAEATANALGMEEVRILPRPSSVGFWLKLDYVSDPRSARVLRKNPADTNEIQTSCRANSFGNKSRDYESACKTC